MFVDIYSASMSFKDYNKVELTSIEHTVIEIYREKVMSYNFRRFSIFDGFLTLQDERLTVERWE